MWALALRLLGWAVGFFFPAKDERDEERKAGERLGVEETENTNAKSGLSEVSKAVKAREDNRGAIASDPGKLLNGKDPAASSYRPGPD